MKIDPTLKKILVLCLVIALLTVAVTGYFYLFGGPGRSLAVEKFKDSNSMIISVKDDWLAFYDVMKDKNYKIKDDGTGLTEIYEDESKSFIKQDYNKNTLNGHIYDVNKKDNKIWEYDDKGNPLRSVTADVSGWFVMDKEMIYYANYGSSYGLNSIGLNGENNKRLCGDGIDGIALEGNWLYYINKSDSNHLYRIRTNGTGRSRLTQTGIESSYGLYVYKGVIYFNNAADNNFIYKVRVS